MTNSPDPLPSSAQASLAQALHDALPQTQCRRCGYDDCAAYAQAMATGKAHINRCPPGGAEGVQRLSALTGLAPLAIEPGCGTEGPRLLAVIDEAWCIGCTLCIKACPADCIVGASKRMHTVIDAQCTGCELCVPVCPVDCIALVPVTGSATGWAAWSPTQAAEARQRYETRQARLQREQRENDARLAAKAQAKLDDLNAATRTADPEALERKRATVLAALARAKAKLEPAAAGHKDSED